MALVQRSFSVLEPAPSIWAALSDFSCWDRLLALKDARAKGWGNRLVPRGPQLGLGTPLDMLYDSRRMQEWLIEEWRPPERLSLCSKLWFGRPNYAMASRLSISLQASSAVETLVSLALDSRFCAFPWGPVLDLIAPLRRELRSVLVRMEDGLLQVLSERGATKPV